jgi:hypothetical protein
MSVLDNLTRQAGRLANDVQASLKRARVEGERRLLQRQHRAALEELGERAYELVRTGALPEEPLAPEIATIESKLMELEAKVAEIDALRDGDDSPPEPAGDTAPGPAATDAPTPTFPAVDGQDDPPKVAGAGPGWDAADRFFRPNR